MIKLKVTGDEVKSGWLLSQSPELILMSFTTQTKRPIVNAISSQQVHLEQDSCIEFLDMPEWSVMHAWPGRYDLQVLLTKSFTGCKLIYEEKQNGTE
jgi:hypothetical protein